ncbi:MAG: SMC-Scp complex subunit ScpB [Proteobacteria bacterium]|nr:SMC-Scp complex subunit ScpB [Pseudomonadota bacterium]
MEREEIKGAIEALIFASQQPLKIDKIAEILSNEEGEDCDRLLVKELLQEIAEDTEGSGRGITLSEIAGGYQFRTKTVHATAVQMLKAKRPPKFGPAAMEVLSIVAYRQPLTRADIEDLRGVDSGGIVRGLLEKRLIKILGRREVPGKPMIYGTTKGFLEHFSMRDLSQLPPLKEFVELDENEKEAAFKRLEQQANK